MISRICKKFDFPTECTSVLEEAYMSVAENPEANELFQKAAYNLSHPNNILFDEATEKLLKTTDIHPHTLNILLCIFCLEELQQNYENINQKEKFDVFVKSLKNKLINHKGKTDIWGVANGFWQWMYHEWQCLISGRLKFEPFYHFVDIPYKGIKKGDPVILIHIASGSPLDIDGVMESLNVAYNSFKDRFENETVPFMTHTWILYPPYLNGIFKKGGNLEKFAGLFDIIAQNEDNFGSFPNIFSCPYPGEDLSNVPQETSLQKNMLQFIKDGNAMGQGYGMFLYNKNGFVKN